MDVYLNGQMVGSAQNAQKKMAQKHAARTALEHLRQQYGAELVRFLEAQVVSIESLFVSLPVSVSEERSWSQRHGAELRKVG